MPDTVPTGGHAQSLDQLMRPDTPADARPDAADAPQVRTVTVRLLDTPGASLTVPCPAWCATDHSDDADRGTYAEDFAHRGEETSLDIDGAGLVVTELTQYPFSRDMRLPTMTMWPVLDFASNGETYLDGAGLRSVAARLREHAATLDVQAATLDRLRGEGA